MTVKELKEALSKLDENLEVVYGYEHALFRLRLEDIDRDPITCKPIFSTIRCEVTHGPEGLKAVVLHR